MFEELMNTKKQIEDLREKFLANKGALVKKAFKEFLDKYPDVLQITWTQYAPYFNDGDACIFHVHEPSLLLRSALEEVPEELPRPRSYCACEQEEGYVDPFQCEGEMKSDFEALWNSLPEDVMKDVFTEDGVVFVERSEIAIDEYQHD